MPKPAVVAAASSALRASQRELGVSESTGDDGATAHAATRHMNSIQLANEAIHTDGAVEIEQAGNSQGHAGYSTQGIGEMKQGPRSTDGNYPAKRSAKTRSATSSALVLPPRADRVLEAEMEKYLGAWKQRKVVLTFDALYFAKTDPQGEEKCIDKIQLVDVWMLDDKEYDVASGTIRALTSQNPLPASDANCIIQLETIATEEHCGRNYLLRTTPALRAQWIHRMSECISRAQKSAQMRNKFLHYQTASRKLFQTKFVRWFFALCIMVSFGCDAVEMQYLPLGRGETEMGRNFFILELVFTCIFTLELVWNMFTYWFWDFWSDSWSLFDTVVVLSSIASVGSEGTNVKSIRMVRVLRALRVVSQFKSLRKIVRALTQAILPVLSAMFVAIIVIAVYAILGVGFYAERAPVLFGDFGRAVWTLVTAATMENWVTYAVDLMGGDPSHLDAGVVVFFISYVVIVAYVLTSVVVAVLLENFSDASQNEHEIESELEESEGLKEAHKTGSFPLDALMAELVQVDTYNDLVMQVDMLFNLLDVDASGELSFAEMQLGLQALDVRPRIQISIDDFHAMTDGGSLLSGAGCLSRNSFFEVTRNEMRNYISRQIGRQSLQPQNQRAISSLFAAVNFLITSRSSEASAKEQVHVGESSNRGNETADLALQIQRLTAKTEQIETRLKEQESARVLAAHTLTQIIDDKLGLHLQLIKDTISGSQRRAVASYTATMSDGGPIGPEQVVAAEPFHLKNLSPRSPTAVRTAAPQLFNHDTVKPRLSEPSTSGAPTLLQHRDQRLDLPPASPSHYASAHLIAGRQGYGSPSPHAVQNQWRSEPRSPLSMPPTGYGNWT